MWAVISKCISLKKDFKCHFFPPKKNVKCFEFFITENVPSIWGWLVSGSGLPKHRIMDLFYKTWDQIHLWVLSTKLSREIMDITHEIEKHWDTYLHIKCTFFFSCCLHTCYPPPNSTEYEMLYIKMSLKLSRKIRNSPRMRGPHWVKSEAISIIMQEFKKIRPLGGG